MACLALAVCLLAMPLGAWGANLDNTWNRFGGDTTYSTAGNWAGGVNVPLTGRVATFNNTAGAGFRAISIDAAGITVGTFNVGDTGYVITTGGGALTFDTGNLITGGAVNLPQFVVSGAGNIVFAATTLPGIGVYNITGTGTVNFSAVTGDGTTANAITAGSIAGTGGIYSLGNNTLTTGGDGTTTSVARVINSTGGGGFMKDFSFGYDNRMLLAASNLTLSNAGNPLIRQGVENRWGIYLEPMANWGNLSATTNQVGYRYKNFGFTLGADYTISAF